jgi:valyl-tRNA synthetase
MLEKQFDPKLTEQHARETWSEQDYAPQGPGTPYCIMLPPPNVTGTLHMGHGYQHTLMDALIRYHRMRGDHTLWQPGTDHAGISTQMVVENQLRREGLERKELGREAFEQRVWQWKEKSGDTIVSQMKRLGATCDWSRSRFTMDAGLSTAVTEAFVKLYNDGLIYRGTRLVNWDPVLQTALSDLEVLTEEEQGSLWYLRYPLVAGDGFLIVATSRPETLFGDVAVAVNPNDERYQHLIGQEVFLPLTERKIPIIADDYVAVEFATACVKVTPAHDFRDFAVGKRHDLPSINIFTPDAKLNQNVPLAYQGLSREAARKQVVAELTAQNLLEKIEPHKLQISRSERSQTIVEPYLSEQWYLQMESLAKPALEVVEQGQIEFVPDNWRNTYRHWLTNIQDWCISRQLWWGHRIPAWHDEAGNIYVAHNEAEAQAQAGAGVQLTQDQDVLDTWFSSALWPFSTLGWPEQTPELAKFYPTNVLVTGFDIIFFWVARMIMFGLYFMKEIPFKQVFITGLIRDQQGQKMSKSKGNVIDPLDLIDGIRLEDLLQKRTSGLMLESQRKQVEKETRKQFPNGIAAFGEDAVRFTYCALATHGRDIRFDLSALEGYRNFCNKLWNATRFIEMQLEKCGVEHLPMGMPAIEACDPIERWLLESLNELIKKCRECFDLYRFDLLADALYAFIWHDFCDRYIEKVKIRLNRENEKRDIILRVLVNALDILLRLLHPLMPFITEDIWRQTVCRVISFPTEVLKKPLMLQPYPLPVEYTESDLDLLKDAGTIINDEDLAINQFRVIRNRLEFKPKEVIGPISIRYRSNLSEKDLIEAKKELNLVCVQSKNMIEAMAKITVVAEEFSEKLTAPLLSFLEIYIPQIKQQQPISEEDQMKQVRKNEENRNKLFAEKEKLITVMDNPAFVAKAPPAVIEKNKQRLAEIDIELTRLTREESTI